MKKDFNYWQKVAKEMMPEMESILERAERMRFSPYVKNAIRAYFAFHDLRAETEIEDENGYTEEFEHLYCRCADIRALLQVKINQWERARSSKVKWYKEAMDEVDTFICRVMPDHVDGIDESMWNTIADYEDDVQKEMEKTELQELKEAV